MQRREMIKWILSLPVLANGAPVLAEPANAPASGKYWVYLGTYTKPGGSRGIYRSELDLKTGQLAAPVLVAELENPSFVNLSPNGQYLYAVGETADSGPSKTEGTVHAFRIDKSTGNLTKLNSLPSGGAHPCHLSVNSTGKFLIVANYTGGSSAVFALKEDGSLGTRTDFQQHQGTGPNKERQTAPHAHCSQFLTLDGVEYAYVVDLGLDQVLSYRLDQKTGALSATLPGSVKLPPSSGPRHIAFHPALGRAYVCGEMDSTCITLQFRKQNDGVLELFPAATPGANHLSTLPQDVPAEVRQRNSTAEIVVHPGGQQVLVSNRGHDSVALFAINREGTTAQGHITSAAGREIKTPRNFNVDPTGQWVLIASQDGDTVRTAQWKGAGTELSPHSIAVGAPCCVKFLPKP
ncbi:MAG: lactonase family protein [Planctomycetaceae bacterium]